VSIQARAGVSSLECPRCHAPLSPSRFARQTQCPYCGATVRVDPSSVETRKFREARQGWEDPTAHGFTQWLTLGGRHWALAGLLAQGETSDVYLAQRARWPTQWVVLKLLRESSQAKRFEREGEQLARLATGALQLGVRAPSFVQRGTVSAGLHENRAALLYAHEPDFRHTFEDVRRALPHGVEPRISVWMWRRVLELLAVLHREGLAHGAVRPEHLLVQDGDHGVRVVGFGALERATPAHAERDVRMSARCLASVLGGDLATGEVPASVPEPLARLLREVSQGRDARDAWALREQLGGLAKTLFGPPSFHPLVLPR
jgi:hypothetical protein